MLAKLLFATERLVKDQNGSIKEEFVQLACSSPHVIYPSTYKQIIGNEIQSSSSSTTTTTTAAATTTKLTVKSILQQNWDTFLNAIGLYKCNSCDHDDSGNNNNCCAFKVASSMVQVSFGSKSQMTAEEGEILRTYFKNYWQ
jgi:hypothetical protein